MDAAEFMMTRDALIFQLLALDLTVSREGVISDGAFDYGVVEDSVIRTVNGETMQIALIDRMEFNMATSYLTAVSRTGAALILQRGKLPESEPKPKKKADPVSAYGSFVGGALKCPRNLAGLNALFPTLYPDWETKLYYDELSEVEMVDMTLFDMPEAGVRPVDDNVMSIYHEHLEIRLNELGFDVARPPSTQNKDEVFRIRTMSNSRNPFREWVETRRWDGMPRLETWFQDLFGATSVVLPASEDDRYLRAVSKAWFLGAIARMYRPTQHDVVPIFIGGQGAGKTRALRYTAGKDEWFRSTSADMTARDTARFLDSVRGGIVVELGEATQLEGGMSSSELKQFISQDSDHFRKAYARKEQVFPRHFILAATTNKTEIFTDLTGNRRFFPMICKPNLQTRIFSVEDRSVGTYEVEQVWAEALKMYRAGERPTLSKDDMALAEKVQDFYAKDVPNVDMIDQWLDDPYNGYTRVGIKITKGMLLKGLSAAPQAILLTTRELDAAVNAWSERTKSWARCMPFRVKDDISAKPQRGWERVFAPGKVPAKATFAMVSTSNKAELDRAKDVTDFRALVKSKSLKSGQEVQELLSEKDLNRYLKAGFLTCTGIGAEACITVEWIP